MGTDVPHGWKLTYLGDSGGFLARKPQLFEGVVPYLATADVNGFVLHPSEQVTFSNKPARAGLQLREGDILQAKMKTTNKVVLITAAEDGWLASTGFAQFHPGDVGTHPGFLFHWLGSEHFNRLKDARCVGTTQQAISDNPLRKSHLLLPPHPEQRRIAEILDTVDDAIHRTERIIAKLKQMKQGLFHDLLTRGIGENGELRDPERHPEQFKDSPLGRIPREWEVRRIPEVASYQVGRPFPSADYGSSGIALLRPGNLQLDEYVIWDTRHTVFIPHKWRQAMSDYVVHPGELVMNLTAQSLEDQFLGRVCLVPPAMECMLNQRIARFRAYGCNLDFLFWSLKGPFFRSQVDRTPQGTKVQHLYNSDLDSFQLPIPGQKDEQEAIAAALFGAASRLRRECRALDKLCVLKHGLMDDLLTGRVRVKVKAEASA